MTCSTVSTSITCSRRCCEGGSESSAREEPDRLAERAEENERDRLAYLRCLALLGEFEGDIQRALGRLREAGALAVKIGLPGELWQVRSKIGELHERRGQTEEAREAFSVASQTLRTLAGKIADEGLRRASSRHHGRVACSRTIRAHSAPPRAYDANVTYLARPMRCDGPQSAG